MQVRPTHCPPPQTLCNEFLSLPKQVGGYDLGPVHTEHLLGFVFTAEKKKLVLTAIELQESPRMLNRELCADQDHASK